MPTRDSIRPIDAMGEVAANLARTVVSTRTPLVLTENGEPAVVIQDVASYRETQEALALTRLVTVIDREIEAGETERLDTAFADIRRRIASS